MEIEERVKGESRGGVGWEWERLKEQEKGERWEVVVEGSTRKGVGASSFSFRKHSRSAGSSKGEKEEGRKNREIGKI